MLSCMIAPTLHRPTTHLYYWRAGASQPKSTFALRMQSEVLILMRLLYATLNTGLCITCVTHKSKGGSEWGKHQKNRLLKRCRMRLSTLQCRNRKLFLIFNMHSQRECTIVVQLARIFCLFICMSPAFHMPYSLA